MVAGSHLVGQDQHNSEKSGDPNQVQFKVKVRWLLSVKIFHLLRISALQASLLSFTSLFTNIACIVQMHKLISD